MSQGKDSRRARGNPRANSGASWSLLNVQEGAQARGREYAVSIGSDSKRPKTLLDVAYESFKSGLYTDVTIVVGKQKFPAHRLVLASLSDYFPPLFKLDQIDGEVTLYNIDPDDFSVLLKYAYTGEVEIARENVQSVLIAADYLSVSHVKQVCQRFMADNLDCENVCDALAFAINYTLATLQASSAQFMKENLDPVSKTDNFADLDQAFLIEFFEDDNLVLYTGKLILKSTDREKMVLIAVLRYLSGRPHRDEEIEAMIRTVRLCEMPKDMVKKCLKDFKNLKKNEVIKKYVQMREVAAKYLCERQQDHSLTTYIGKEAEDIPDTWFRHRKLASFSISVIGRRYAAGGQIARCPNPPNYLYEDQNFQIQGIKIWLRRWDGRVVIGGLTINYLTPCSDGRELKYERGACRGPADHEVELEPEEVILKVKISSGYLIDQLGFETNTGRVLGPFGGPGGGSHTEVAPSGALSYLYDINCNSVTTQGSDAIFNLMFRWITFE